MDIDMESVESSSALTTTTISQGEVHVVPKDGANPVLSTAFTSVHQTYTTTSSTNSASSSSSQSEEDFNNNNSKESRVDQISFSTRPNTLPCQTQIKENPFRRVFAKRKQFYQRLSDSNKADSRLDT